MSNNDLNLGLVVNGMDPDKMGALPRNVFELSKCLKSKKIIFSNGGSKKDYEIKGIKVHQLRSHKRSAPPFTEQLNLMKKLDVNLVNFHGSLLGCMLFSKVYQKAHMPIIFNLYSFKLRMREFLHLKFSDFRFRSRIFDDTIDNPGSFIPDSFLRRYLDRNNIKKIIVPSIKMKNELEKSLHKNNHVYNIPPGVNGNRFKRLPADDISRFKEEIGFKKDDKIVFHTGLATTLRGVDDIIIAMKDVCKNVSNSKLLIAIYSCSFAPEHCDYLDNHIRYIQKFATRNLGDNVKIITEPIDKIEYYYNASDLVLLPYRFSADFPECPLTLIEAMATETPVISTNIGAIPEYVPNDDYLISPKDISGLKKLTIQLLSNSDLCGNVGKENRNFIEKNHNWQIISDRIEDIYKEANEEHEKQ